MSLGHCDHFQNIAAPVACMKASIHSKAVFKVFAYDVQ